MIRLRSLCVATAFAASALVAGHTGGVTAAGPSGGGCELNGAANFGTPLTNNSANFTYNFAGALTPCQGGPASGSVSAGNVETIGGFKYQEPIPTGNGSCASSTTSGTSIITWADGTKTVISFTTTGAAAVVSLSGTVVPSVTLTALPGQPTAPPTATVSTTRYAGGQAIGALAFEPPDPTACNGAGVKTAGIQGITTVGTQS